MSKTFYRWLGFYVEVDSIIGDLARDVRDDPDADAIENNLDSWMNHLPKDKVVVDTLKEAWDLYENE